MDESLFPTRWAHDKPPSLEKFTSDFADDYACAEYLAKKRWRSGFKCPKCGGNRAWRLEARPWVWECQGIVAHGDGTRTSTGCRHQTSLIAGTVMHGSHLPLRTWFLAAYMVATHTNGMSALQLQPKLGLGSYKTAWLLLHKLRRAMVNPDRSALSGTIQVDETNVMYRKKSDPPDGGQGNSSIGKIKFAGAVEVRDKFYPGRIRLQSIENNNRFFLHDFVLQNTTAGSHIVTDGNTSYNGLPERLHTAKNLSSRNALPAHITLKWIHIVFGNFKRWGMGTFHGFRDKHVDAYASEFVFRWNRRRQFHSNIDTILGLGHKIGVHSYRSIVGDTSEWKRQHKKAILKMVLPERLAEAKVLAKQTRCDIFEAIEIVRSMETKTPYTRRRSPRPALPPRRPGEERNTRRYQHPPRPSANEVAMGYLRHIPPGSPITL